MKFNSRTYLFFAAIWLSFNSVFGDTIKVCSSCPVRSIREAIELSRPGDVVKISGGNYSEGEIKIDRRISLIGINVPRIEGNDSTDVILVNADSVLIRGLNIRNMGLSYIKDLAGIKINGRRDCEILDNVLDNTFFGIYLKNASNCTVRGNIITGRAVNELSSGNAIHLWYSRGIEVSGNTCRNHRDGIYLEFVENSRIRNNLSEGNLRYGLHFMFSNHDKYYGNIFRNNGAGVAVMFSRFIDMEENIFEKNWGPSSYGLLLKDIFDGEIRNNIFRENTFGIFADGSNRININHNEFVRNGWALKILGSCMQDTITENNFSGNSFDVITNSASNTNIYKRNYWGDYNGYDLDHDGVGDIPHHPAKLFSYIVSNVPSSLVLLHSTFVDLVNLAEKVAPTLSPKLLVDDEPLMKRTRIDGNQ